MEKKFCTKCSKSKKTNDFDKDTQRKDGLSSLCHDCRVLLAAKWRDKNREIIREKQRKHYKKNCEEIKIKRKKNYDPIKSKARWLAKKIEREQCIFCDKLGERHHKDYNHPLDIVFLCKSHHKQVHDETIKL